MEGNFSKEELEGHKYSNNLLTFHISTPGLPKGSSVCPTVEVSRGPKVAQQRLQEVLDRKRAHDVAIASDEGASSISPQPKG